MRALLLAPVVVLAATGCIQDDKTPPEKLTLEVATQNAQSSVVPGVETRNFKRENGWVDTKAANLYLVRYNYEMVLTRDLPEAALELAKIYEQNQKGNQKNSGFMGINEWGNLFQLKINANNWINGQDNFAQRRDRFLSQCAPCSQYWNSDEGGKDAAELRRYSYIQAWSHLEGMGFGDGQKKGDGVPWNISPSFMKTENGWMEAK